jgi:hypothetical protein
VRAIARSSRPASRAVEALSATAPLFLLLFATGYFLMAAVGGSNFNLHTLTGTDSLYFTVTVVAIVGLGDINPTSQAARMLVTVQMILPDRAAPRDPRLHQRSPARPQRISSRSQEG